VSVQQIYSYPRIEGCASSQTNYAWVEWNAEPGKLIVESSGLWLHLPCKLNLLASASYYAIQDVGVGSTSRAFHALDDRSSEYVIKMYVNRYNEEKIYFKKFDFMKRISVLHLKYKEW
jgi:hypothetical protein